MKLLLVAGARPNFMKIAPLVHEMTALNDDFSFKVVHTGQHYDQTMSDGFFADFDLPRPDHYLEVGSGSHAVQTAKVMTAFEPVCQQEAPDVVVVVGDINSTVACALTAKKLNIKVAHVEAGLRSRDLAMPEEINRIATDAISDYLYVTEKSGMDNLLREGKSTEQCAFVGNIMIDTLHFCLRKLERARRSPVAQGVPDGGPYAVTTLHRPSNVDDRDKLTEILTALGRIASDMPVFFPMHPRTRKNVMAFGLEETLTSTGIRVMPPLSYLDFLGLWKDAALVLTDSGGIQEETTALGVPCFTVRENTERPITISEGTNTLVGASGEGILKSYEGFRSGGRKTGQIPELWDGQAAGRILAHLRERA